MVVNSLLQQPKRIGWMENMSYLDMSFREWILSRKWNDVDRVQVNRPSGWSSRVVANCNQVEK